jgi:hypothetical protein
MPLYRIEEVKETTGGGCLGLIAIIVIIGYVMNQQKQKTEDKPKTEKVQNKDSIDDVNKKRIYKTITKKTKSISFGNEEDVISYLDGKEFYSDSNIILKVDGDRIMVNDNRIYTDIKIILEDAGRAILEVKSTDDTEYVKFYVDNKIGCVYKYRNLNELYCIKK